MDMEGAGPGAIDQVDEVHSRWSEGIAPGTGVGVGAGLAELMMTSVDVDVGVGVDAWLIAGLGVGDPVGLVDARKMATHFWWVSATSLAPKEYQQHGL